MKAKNCGLSDEQRLRRRLHYCGTCKTIGALYGQKSRLLLNHDIVFLAEILTALSGENQYQSWQPAFQSYNCLALPQDEIPLALEFAATANVVLTEFKIKDQLADEQKLRWQFAQRTLAGSFTTAHQKLAQFKFPLEQLRRSLLAQEEREANITGDTADEILAFLAEPTATATALFFAHGAKVVGSQAAHETMFALGFAFGELIYLLDAFEDYEKDFRSHQFNALRSAFGATENQLTAAVAGLRRAQNKVTENLEKLPLAVAIKRLLGARLNENLSKKLKTDLPILPKQKTCRPPRRHLSIATRWQIAKSRAKQLTAENFAARSIWQSANLPIAFAIVAVVAFIAPHEAARAKSWQDCAGMSFNLMFLGSLMGTVLVWPKKMAAATPPEITEKAARKLKRRAESGGEDGGWCDFCDCCDCDDGCDCCCECDSCGCDACGCSGCCDC